MSGPIQMVSIIIPKPGKIDQVIEILAPYCDFVEATQPGALQYQLFKQTNGDAEVLVYLEVFKDMEALEAHRQTDEHKALTKRAAESGLLAAMPDTKILAPVGGFAMRK